MKIIIILSIIFVIYGNTSARERCNCYSNLLGKQGFGPGDQDWGYVNVRRGAHMFYWLYKVKFGEVKSNPLIVWLQGGPGCSSTGFGNYMEIGPWFLNLTERPDTWVTNYNVLFIDNPVGTGFSYVDRKSALAKTNKQIAKDLVEFMTQFYIKCPDFISCPLLIVGESYGGKMATEFAWLLLQAKNEEPLKAPLKDIRIAGITLIDSWISPVDIVENYGPMLYALGKIDEDNLVLIKSQASAIKKALFLRRFGTATEKWQTTLEIISNLTNNIDFYNVHTRTGVNTKANKEKLETLMNGPVKMNLKLKQWVNWTMDNTRVFNALKTDFMKPVTAIIHKLLTNTSLNIQVIIGEFDLIVNTAGTLQWVNRLPTFKDNKNWLSTDRTIFCDKKVNLGFKKSLGPFSLYMVKNAGHMVPIDNPKAMQGILDDNEWPPACKPQDEDQQ